MTDAASGRSQAKQDRRTLLLREAARMYALHGFHGVPMEDLGAACGISGPAVYRHFSGKSAVLAALLGEASRHLLDGGRAAAAAGGGPTVVLRRLVSFHTDFALGHPDLIRVQERDLAALSPADAQVVRGLQRAYLGVWAEQLVRLRPGTEPTEAYFQTQAVFGLINSTPHTVHRGPTDPALRKRLLEGMAWAALCAPVR